jgi:hypothetical protein
LCVPLLPADDIKLKSGSSWDNVKILHQERDSIEFQAAFGVINVPVSMIESINGVKVADVLPQKEQVTKKDASASHELMPDDQYFDYLKTKYADEIDQGTRADLMKSYLSAYPKGKHMGEATALLEKAQTATKVGSLLLKCRVTLGNGNTVAVHGWIQLLRSAKSYNEVTQEMLKDEMIQLFMKSDAVVKQGQKEARHYIDEANSLRRSMGQPDLPYPDEDVSEGPLVSEMGRFLSKISATKVAEAEIKDGDIDLPNVPPGEYLIYGAGQAGINFVGYFDHIKIQGGRMITVTPTCHSVFCPPREKLDINHFLGCWKPH